MELSSDRGHNVPNHARVRLSKQSAGGHPHRPLVPSGSSSQASPNLAPTQPRLQENADIGKYAWKTGFFRRLPLVAIAALIGSLGCMSADYCNISPGMICSFSTRHCCRGRGTDQKRGGANRSLDDRAEHISRHNLRCREHAAGSGIVGWLDDLVLATRPCTSRCMRHQNEPLCAELADHHSCLRCIDTGRRVALLWEPFAHSLMGLAR